MYKRSLPPGYEHKEPHRQCKFAFGATTRLPNDFLVLENESLSPSLRRHIADILDIKPVSQAAVPDLLGGIILSRFRGTPPMPLSLHAVMAMDDALAGTRSNDNLFLNAYRSIMLTAISIPATVCTRLLLSVPIMFSHALGSLFRTNWTWTPHQDLLSQKQSEKPPYAAAALFPYLLETKITKVNVPSEIKECLKKDNRISSSVIDNSILADYNRGQIDDYGRLVFSKHPLSRRSSKVGLFRQIQRVASWYSPFRRASFKVANVCVREKDLVASHSEAVQHG